MAVQGQLSFHDYLPAAAMAAEALTGVEFTVPGDLRVTHIAAATAVETLLSEGVHYTIGGDGPNGAGTITALAAWPVADVFHVERVTARTQTAVFDAFERPPPKEIEAALDRVVMMVQENDRDAAAAAVEAALSAAAAAAVGRYYATRAGGAAVVALGEMFVSDEGGTLAIYTVIAGAPYYQFYDNVPTSAQIAALTAANANLANSSDPAKGAALVGYRGGTAQAGFDKIQAKRGLGSILRGRRFKRIIGAQLGYTTAGAPNSVTVASVAGYPADSTDTNTLRVKADKRRKITSLNCPGAGAPNYMIVVCPERHGLVAGDRIRIEGSSSGSTSGPNTSVNTLGYGVDGGTAIKYQTQQSPIEQRQWGRAHTVWDVTDDFIFRIKMAGAFALSDAVAGIYWEPLATWWDATNPAISWVVPGSPEALPAITQVNATSYPSFGQFSSGSPAGIGAATGSMTSKTAVCEFMLYEDAFQLSNVRGKFRIFADDVPVTNGVIDVDQPSFPGYRTLFTFPAAKPAGGRRIRIETAANPFNVFGIFTRGRDAIGPIPQDKRRPLMMVCGDSFPEGTGAATQHHNCAALLADRLGCDWVQGSLGSTGLTTNGIQGAGMNYLDRMKVMKAAGIEPDLICVVDSVNDAGNVTEALANAGILRLRELWPSIEIIVLGRLNPNETIPGTALTSTANWITACKNYGVPYVDGGIGALGKPVWISAGNKYTYYHGVQATGTATVTANAVTAVAVNTAGQGYDPASGAPAVSFSGGGGTGAAATAVMDYKVTDIAIINGGKDYTTATLTLDHGASAFAIISAGAVLGIMVQNAGVLFTTPPSVTLTGGGGTGATATAVLEGGKLIGFTITAGGSGYATAPTVNIGICTGVATATATLTAGVITGVTITSAGSLYTDTPICNVTGDGYGAELVPFISGTVASVTVTNGGSGYSGTPTVAIVHPNGNDPTHPKSNGHRMLAHRWARELEELVAA